MSRTPYIIFYFITYNKRSRGYFHMQYISISCILATIICIWLIIVDIAYFPPHEICRMYGASNAVEMYQDSKKMVLREPIMSDRYMYFQAGMQCFFTSFEKTADIKPEEFLAWIRDNNFFIYFWPNYQDLCCKSEKERHENCDCENIDVRLSSFEDDAYNYHNESRSQSIESNLGATNKNNCMVTLLGNDYILQKRTIRMKVKDKERVNKSRDMYRITIEHKDLMAFVLSRPLFMSFSGSGIAAVIHEDYDRAIGLEEFEDKNERNIFSYFGSSQDRSSHHLLVREFKDGKLSAQNNFSIFSSAKYSTYKDPSKDQLCTLYYLTFLREVHDIPQAYAVNFCVNKKLFDEKRDAVYITLDMNDEDPSLVHKVAMIKDDGRLSLRVNQHDYEMPDEFDIHDPYLTHFDVFFTIAFNIIIIVCLGKNSVSKQSVVFMKRHHIKKRFQSDKTFLHQAFREQVPKMYQYMQTHLDDVICLTAVPNYAKIAYKLGYMNSVL